MKKLITGALVLLILGAIVITLISNKEKRSIQVQNQKREMIATVSVAKVTKQPLIKKLSQVGVITANNDVLVIAETRGKVVRVFVEPGTSVKKGTPLVQVDNELAQAKLLAVEANFQKAQKDFERYLALHEEELITDSQYEAVRLALKAAKAEFTAAQRAYNNATVTAPIAGVLTKRMVNLGSMIGPQTPVANIVDISKLKVKLNLPEADVFRVKVGDPVAVETDIYPEVKFSGKITNISIKGDEAHTYPVEILIKNHSQNQLKAGMFCRVNFKLNNQNQATPEVLTIPREALVGSIKNPYVFVIKENQAYRRKITLGMEAGTTLEVKNGLTAGEAVVIAGQYDLKDQMQVSIAK